MFKMIQELQIGSLTLLGVKRVQLESSRKEPSDILRIYLPKYKGMKKNDIKYGDKVKWKAGYEESGLIEEFIGTVTKVSDTLPLEIVCKDYMHDLQLKRMKRNFASVTVRRLAKLVAPKFKSIIQPSIAGKRKRNIYCNRKSSAWALEKLPYDVFFRHGKLHIQAASDVKTTDNIKLFQIGFNIISDKIQTKSEQPIRVKVRSYDEKKGKFNQYIFPKRWKTGEIIIKELDGLEYSTVKKKAAQIWYQLAGKGLSGQFTTFGYPSVNHSEVILVVDPYEENRSSEAFVNKVIKTFDVQEATYRQEVYLKVVKRLKKRKKK
jgi:hypothetical protein